MRVGNSATNRRLSPVDAPVGSGAETELIVRTPGSKRNAGSCIACAESGRLQVTNAIATTDAVSHAVNVAERTDARSVKGLGRERVTTYGSSSENVWATIIIGTLIDSLRT